MIRRNESGRVVGEYQALVPDELRLALAEDVPVFLPMGSVEWHNNHLPLNTDSIIAEGLCMHVAERTGGLVLPANPWATACTARARGPYAFEPALGTVALFDKDLYVRLVRGIAFEIVRNGFRRFVILAGHVGADDREAMETVAEEVNADGRAKAMFVYPYRFTRGDHAGHWETLMVLGLQPKAVRSGKTYIPYKYGVDVTGTECAEEGRRKIEEVVQALAAEVERFFSS